MDNTIWKIRLHPVDVQTVEIPLGAKILHCREQDDAACIWFLCDPTQLTQPRRFRMYGTGHDEPVTGSYVGTCMLREGRLVVHVFEHETAN